MTYISVVRPQRGRGRHQRHALRPHQSAHNPLAQEWWGHRTQTYKALGLALLRIIPVVLLEVCASKAPLAETKTVFRVFVSMATVLQAMTLGQANKMYNVIQQHSPTQTNCVIVSTAMTSAAKSVIQGKRPLAPATERSSVLVTNGNDLRCKRKIQFVPYGGPTQQPASVARRNARERNRVKQVNNGFATLRQHIPPAVAQAFSPNNSSGRGASKKLSKVETLRLAVEYIRSLQQMIEDHEAELGNTSSSESMQDNRFYNNSPDMQYTYLLPTPACSEASASPTPSHHSSEGSISTTSFNSNLHLIQQNDYENYDPRSPEDEELLDAIFHWQQE